MPGWRSASGGCCRAASSAACASSVPAPLAGSSTPRRRSLGAGSWCILIWQLAGGMARSRRWARREDLTSGVCYGARSAARSGRPSCASSGPGVGPRWPLRMVPCGESARPKAKLQAKPPQKTSPPTPMAAQPRQSHPCCSSWRPPHRASPANPMHTPTRHPTPRMGLQAAGQLSNNEKIDPKA